MSELIAVTLRQTGPASADALACPAGVPVHRGISWRRIRQIGRNGSIAGLLALVAAPAAGAAWTVLGSGDANARAGVLSSPAAPTASSDGSAVTLSWTPPADGAGVQDGYLIHRFDEGGSAQTIGTGCAGTQAGSSCTESNVPAGTWRYSISARSGSWTSPESAQTLVATTETPIPAPASLERDT